MIRLCVRAALLFLVPLLVAPAAAQSGETHAVAKEKAKGAAQSWLARVDADEFEASWEEASPLLQRRTERADWVQRAEQLRDTIKTVTDRTLTTTRYRDSLRRAPRPGPAVLLNYRSTFEAGRVDELVVTVRADTTWKVAGYQVTPLRKASPRSTASSDSSNP